jgi:hypothetical protein
MLTPWKGRCQECSLVICHSGEGGNPSLNMLPGVTLLLVRCRRPEVNDLRPSQQSA